MARFFFHFRCSDQSITDCEGVALDDPGAARDEARRIAADFIDQASGEPHAKWWGWRIEVSDSRGRRILVLPLEDFGVAGDAAAEMPTPAPQRIVHLDMVRNARALIVLRNQARELIRQAALL